MHMHSIGIGIVQVRAPHTHELKALHKAFAFGCYFSQGENYSLREDIHCAMCSKGGSQSLGLLLFSQG